MDIFPVNTVFKKLKVKDLIPLCKPATQDFQDAILESVKKSGIRDAFFIHYVTNIPMKENHGALIKTGNNRYIICKQLGIEEVPCLICNYTGKYTGPDAFTAPFMSGEPVTCREDIRKRFYSNKKVKIIGNRGVIVNAFTPHFLEIIDDY